VSEPLEPVLLGLELEPLVPIELDEPELPLLLEEPL
jgi:hypothetical protein